MGGILILNGSPRAARSNSKRYAAMLEERCGCETAYLPISKTNHQALCGKLGEVSDVVLAFPLYADGIPVTLLNFLKALERHPPKHRPTVSVLINCGFLECRQNDVAVEMVRLFAGKRVSIRLRAEDRQRRSHLGHAVSPARRAKDPAVCGLPHARGIRHMAGHHAAFSAAVPPCVHGVLDEVRRAQRRDQGADGDDGNRRASGRRPVKRAR